MWHRNGFSNVHTLSGHFQKGDRRQIAWRMNLKVMDAKVLENPYGTLTGKRNSFRSRSSSRLRIVSKLTAQSRRSWRSAWTPDPGYTQCLITNSLVSKTLKMSQKYSVWTQKKFRNSSRSRTLSKLAAQSRRSRRSAWSSLNFWSLIVWCLKL